MRHISSPVIRKGEAICVYICNPDAFRQHTASSKVSSTSQPQGVGITLSSPSFRGGAQDDQGFGVGSGGISDVIGSAASLSEEFKLWLNRHPGLSIDEAIRRYRDEQKAKQRRKGPKL